MYVTVVEVVVTETSLFVCKLILFSRKKLRYFLSVMNRKARVEENIFDFFGLLTLFVVTVFKGKKENMENLYKYILNVMTRLVSKCHNHKHCMS